MFRRHVVAALGGDAPKVSGHSCLSSVFFFFNSCFIFNPAFAEIASAHQSLVVEQGPLRPSAEAPQVSKVSVLC